MPEQEEDQMSPCKPFTDWLSAMEKIAVSVFKLHRAIVVFEEKVNAIHGSVKDMYQSAESEVSRIRREHEAMLS